MLGDTTGMANPQLVRHRGAELMVRFPGTEFIAHFHDTRGTDREHAGAAGAGRALRRHLDGRDRRQPATGLSKYSAGFTGNTCSEDLVALLDEMGVETGIDVDKLIEAGRRGEEILGSGCAPTWSVPAA